MKTNPKIEFIKHEVVEVKTEDPLDEELAILQNGTNQEDCAPMIEEPLHLRLKHQLMQKLHPNGIPEDDDEDDDDEPLKARLMKRRYPTRKCKKQKKEELVNQMKNQLKKVLKNGGLNNSKDLIVPD